MAVIHCHHEWIDSVLNLDHIVAGWPYDYYSSVSILEDSSDWLDDPNTYLSHVSEHHVRAPCLQCSRDEP